jgi:hypothetical protein
MANFPGEPTLKVLVTVSDKDNIKQAAKETTEQVAISKSYTLELARDSIYALLLKGADSLAVTIAHSYEKDATVVQREITLTKGNLKEIY